jgi:hypothetical protein
LSATVGDFSEKTIKWLFGPATHCAFPGCEEAIAQRIDGKLIVVAQIAHIRSEEPGGPRHDPAYAQPNGFENLLLACGKHHKLIDDYPADYPVELLEEWKTAQLEQGRDERLSADDFAVIVAHFISSTLNALTTVDLSVDLVGGLQIPGAMISIPVNALSAVKIDGVEPKHFVGVSVSNVGIVAVEISGVGLDLDFAFEMDASVYSPWTFPSGSAMNPGRPVPYRLLGHAGGSWFQPMDAMSGVILQMLKQQARVLERVRAFVITGSGIRVESDWVAAIDLPVWREGFSADDLAQMRTMAEEARAKLRSNATEANS